MTLEKQELDRLATAKAAIGTAIAGKGVAVPSGTKLDGMAALIDGIEQGGGGEDVSAETAEYTELLTDLETAIDALPDAGSGGGSGGTCTVKMFTTFQGDFAVFRPIYIDGVSNSVSRSDQGFDGNDGSGEIILTDVACNSLVIINIAGYDSGANIICDGCEYAYESQNAECVAVFITVSPGETATVEFCEPF
jgi:hypothetical protein